MVANHRCPTQSMAMIPSLCLSMIWVQIDRSHTHTYMFLLFSLCLCARPSVSSSLLKEMSCATILLNICGVIVSPNIPSNIFHVLVKDSALEQLLVPRGH